MQKIATKTFSKYKKPLMDLPDLISWHRELYDEFLNKTIRDTIMEFSPMTDSGNKKFELSFDSFELIPPENDEYHAKREKQSYAAILRVRATLKNHQLETENSEEFDFAQIPYMTPHGTFIISGVERVIKPQLARSYGVFFTLSEDKRMRGRFFGAQIRPARGAWVEIETNHDGVIYVRIDKKRRFPLTSLLRVFGMETDDEIKKAFAKDKDALAQIQKTLAKDPAKNLEQSLIEIYRRQRDGDIGTIDNMREYITNLFSEKMYDLSEVGRYHFSRRILGKTPKKGDYKAILDQGDIMAIVSEIIRMNHDPHSRPDDIDHMASRRVRFVGELLNQKIRTGMLKMRRFVNDRMSTIDVNTTLPLQLINPRSFQSEINSFFATGQLSKYMAQENILNELDELATISALGPGGLVRERAGLEVRDVHSSHYGRVCPINTPEGPNIGLILRLATYARVNEFGIIETPYARVKNGRITSEIVYMNARDEEEFIIAHYGNDINDRGELTDEYVEARIKSKPGIIHKNSIEFIDVATTTPISVSTSLIPFLESDDANRALMGQNMMKQATPCLVAHAPLVGTGMEEFVARGTGRLVIANSDGEVIKADSRSIIVKNSKGKKEEYDLINFERTNDNSCLHQRPIVTVGDKVKKGMVIADASSSHRGQLALGQNVLVAFMCLGGNNFEDAIVLSERLIKDAVFSSIRIEEHECIIRDTKFGAEEITFDIPNVSEIRLRHLDEEGIVRVGAEVHENDILVGKVTPKNETDLTPEEKLLRSIFGEKSRDVKDTSLRMGRGKSGRVIGVKVFSRDLGHKLEPGILKKVYVELATVRNIQVGDKLAGRHGNKGVVSVILPEEDMPYTADGTPIDVVLTPLGVPSRLNLGQILEMHLGLAANTLGYQAIVPSFSGASVQEIQTELERAGHPTNGKTKLFDGRTGEAFDQNIATGYVHLLKLHHMVDDKIHARSVGSYSIITQQPLGGKAHFGGQRFGEMEVWALEGYGAAHTLRELMTIKSDDILGRAAAYDSIIRGEDVQFVNAPASFGVLNSYLRGLCLDTLITHTRQDSKPELVEEEGGGGSEFVMEDDADQNLHTDSDDESEADFQNNEIEE